MMGKIGLLGGTFNPVHQGHLSLGLQVKEVFQLDRVLFILSARPPHKQKIRMPSVTIRWRMLQTALQPFPDLVPCDIEMNRDQYSWTYETVIQLQQLYPKDQLYFISGSEGFLNIPTWKKYKQLLAAIPFIVILRTAHIRPRVEKLLKNENIPPLTDPAATSALPRVYLFSYHSNTIHLSSTMIRERIKSKLAIDGMVPREVKKIMEEHKLYES
jgi:nicotinate-nucleotide adenylyltransferase